jgi:hypothetical protein
LISFVQILLTIFSYLQVFWIKLRSHFSSLPCYLFCPPHPPLSEHPNNILQEIKIMEVLIPYNRLHQYVISLHLGPNIPYSVLSPYNHSMCCPISGRHQVSRPLKQQIIL